MDLKPLLRKLGTVGRAAFTILFALVVMAVMVWAYVQGFTLANSQYSIIAFGFYGLILGLHVLTQSLFAFVEHRRMRSRREPCSYTKTIGLTISAYQEDPAYLKECLNSIRALQYPPELLRVIMVVDGNKEDDIYMMDMFKEVFADQNPGFYKWDHNYHTWDPRPQAQEQQGEQTADSRADSQADSRSVRQADSQADNQSGSPAGDEGLGVGEEDPQRIEVEELIRTKRCVCIMQQWGGKREVMYTAFKALGHSVDYVQVCDSDTKLDPLASVELCKVLESNEKYGAVGGDVKILNLKDSYISFMSSLRYWMAFNVERACQSFFNCVSCISGPLGLYRNDLLQQFLEAWYNQKFLGTHCTFGDDRHLTNRMLSMGYATKYTARSKCFTETPAQFLRWLNQQTRWTKSYFREWLYNSLWWHKHSLWMPYEAIVSGIFPFFVTATVIKLFWTGSLWDILWVLCCIQIIGLIKASYACLLRKNFLMIFMSLYSMLYMTSLLPAKYFAIITMNKSSWGTSGRRNIVGNYIPLLPLSIWTCILVAGLCYTIYRETKEDWSSPQKQLEIKFLIYGSVAYVLYWLFMILLYWIWFRRLCRKRSDGYNVSV